MYSYYDTLKPMLKSSEANGSGFCLMCDWSIAVIQCAVPVSPFEEYVLILSKEQADIL